MKITASRDLVFARAKFLKISNIERWWRSRTRRSRSRKIYIQRKSLREDIGLWTAFSHNTFHQVSPLVHVLGDTYVYISTSCQVLECFMTVGLQILGPCWYKMGWEVFCSYMGPILERVLARKSYTFGRTNWSVGKMRSQYAVIYMPAELSLYLRLVSFISYHILPWQFRPTLELSNLPSAEPAGAFACQKGLSRQPQKALRHWTV